MSELTAAQKAADQQLEAAIDALETAYAEDIGEGGGGVITDWVLLTARANYDDDGDQITTHSSFVGPGDPPIFRLVGLVDLALAKWRRNWLRED